MRNRSAIFAVRAGLTLALAALAACTAPSRSLDLQQNRDLAQRDAAAYIERHYVKSEHLIPMRDGVRLHTVVYAPRDTSNTYPFLITRTPYSAGPYGERSSGNPGPNARFSEEGFIFVRQDVRGKYLSEGEFVNMRPHNPAKAGAEVDESTDTYDTIEWLINNIPNHNGRAGLWGISYPGFYAAAGMIDAHPALKAVSPQAPISDWWFEDFYHHGAFFLPHAFNFFASFGRARPEPTADAPPRFDHGTPDGYQFFMDLGPLSNVNERYFKNEIAFWNDIVNNPTYNEYWRSRNIKPHLRNVAPYVMVVGGWYDAENLYGALRTYEAVENQNPAAFNALVMGPWAHGGWERSSGARLGNATFGSNTSEWYRDNVSLPFFRAALKGDGTPPIAEATVFETGANRWRTFDAWPPPQRRERTLYLHPGGRLAFEPPDEPGADAFVSDPAKPVPFSEAIAVGMTQQYMTDDQRFAARRPDVLVYQTEPLTEDITLAGPMLADLWVSTTGQDADWVVKLIDVFPPNAKDPEGLPPGRRMGGYQKMVRSEAIRGRFRDSYSDPKPFTPGQPTHIDLPVQDVLHTFRKGHRIMIQVQSTWFPMMDRNPQTWVDSIFQAREEDFRAQTHRVHREPGRQTALRVGVIDTPPIEDPAPPATPAADRRR